MAQRIGEQWNGPDENAKEKPGANRHSVELIKGVVALDEWLVGSGWSILGNSGVEGAVGSLVAGAGRLRERQRTEQESGGEGFKRRCLQKVSSDDGKAPNGLRLSCGPPAPQRRKMASTGHTVRSGASGPTASSAC